MSYFIHRWKQLVLSLCLLCSLLCCKKAHIDKENDSSQSSEQTPLYQSSIDSHGQSYCGSIFTTELKIEDGTSIGSVDVSNDTAFLFLTYHLAQDWYLADAQCFAGAKSDMPLTGRGNPDYKQFPGKKELKPCDLNQTLSFKVSLSKLSYEAGGQCPSNIQYLVAMRAGVKQVINNSGCDTGAPVDAWAAPVVINPGDASEWATTFYYCRQECEPPTGPDVQPSWCALGQGYWFAKPNVNWCQDHVQFGNLTIAKDDGRALWPAQNNLPKKAFFQASALQLSMVCNNNNQPVPSSIAADYTTLVDFLSQLSYADIQNGTVPQGTDVQAIQTASGNIGKWICRNNCNPSIDPTDCQ